VALKATNAGVTVPATVTRYGGRLIEHYIHSIYLESERVVRIVYRNSGAGTRE